MNRFALLTAWILSGFLSLAGQSSIDLTFQGLLSDIQGKRIANEKFELLLNVVSAADQTILWEALSSTGTDEEGWFSFSINGISAYLLENGKMSRPLVIQMSFLPGKGTRWLRQGDDFQVSYSLTPLMVEGEVRLKMTRTEGSELVTHTEDHLFAFKDQYPFAYLTGGFLVSDKPPISNGSVEDLQQWLSPDSEMEEDAASRGIKGGFPVGGYRKKN
ncbi:MAG: hypothetical protein EHM46_04485 [Bacteroidetes bacterium]|nr:MAG: hypothetical protein EHM46_04485 [Bacteroidota bacterium]